MFTTKFILFQLFLFQKRCTQTHLYQLIFSFSVVRHHFTTVLFICALKSTQTLLAPLVHLQTMDFNNLVSFWCNRKCLRVHSRFSSLLIDAAFCVEYKTSPLPYPYFFYFRDMIFCTNCRSKKNFSCITVLFSLYLVKLYSFGALFRCFLVGINQVLYSGYRLLL